MRPTRPFGPVWLLKASALLVPARTGFEERQSSSAPFLAAIEPAIRVNERALGQGLLLPNSLPGFELLAAPSFAVRISVNVIAAQQYTPMMIHHHFVGIDLGRCESSVRLRDFEKITTRAITGSHIDVIIIVNRRWDHRCGAPAGRSP